jgi:hypothetical protein
MFDSSGFGDNNLMFSFVSACCCSQTGIFRQMPQLSEAHQCRRAMRLVPAD